MYCYRRMLHLNWTMKVTNKEVRKRLNIKTDLMQTIMKRKLGLFGHNMQNGEQQKTKKCDVGNYGAGRLGAAVWAPAFGRRCLGAAVWAHGRLGAGRLGAGPYARGNRIL